MAIACNGRICLGICRDADMLATEQNGDISLVYAKRILVNGLSDTRELHH